MNSNNQDMASLDLLFGESGNLLSETERKEMIRRKGLCQTCGLVKVTESTTNLFRRNKAISNEDVWEGVCIRCNRDRVPDDVGANWERRNNERRGNFAVQQSARMLNSSHNNNSSSLSRRRVAPRRIQSERVAGHHASFSSAKISRGPLGRTASSDRRAFRGLVTSPDDTRQHGGGRLDDKSSNLGLSKTPDKNSNRKLVAALGDSFRLSLGKSTSDRNMAIIASFQKHSIKSVQEALQSLRSDLVYSEYEGFSGMNCIQHLEEILKPGASLSSVQATAGQVLWILAATNGLDVSGFSPPNAASIDFCLCAYGSCIDIPGQSIACILQSIRLETLEWGARCLHRHIGLLEEFSNEDSHKFVAAAMEESVGGSTALFWAGQFILATFDHFEAPSTLTDSAFISFLVTVIQNRMEPANFGSHDLLVTLMEVMTHILESADPEILRFDVAACFTVAAKAINEFSEEDERVSWAAGRLLAVLVTVAQPRALQSFSAVVKALIYSMNRQSNNPCIMAALAHAVWKLSSVPDMITMTELRQALSIISAVTAESRGEGSHRDLSLPLCAIVSNICTLPGAKLDDLPIDMLGDAITDHPSDPTVCDYAFRGLSRILCLFPGAQEIVLQNLGRPNIVVAFSVTPLSSDADVISMVNSVQLSPLPDPMVTLLSQLMRRMGARLQYLRDEVKLKDLLSLTSSLASGGKLKANPQIALIVRRLEKIVNDRQLVPRMRADCCTVLRDLQVHSDAKISLSNILPALQFLSDLPDTRIDFAIISLLYAVASNITPDRSPQPTSSMFTLLVRILHKHNHVDAFYESEIFRVGSGTFSALCSGSNFQVGTTDIGSIAESAYKVLESDKSDSDSIANFLSALLVFCEDALDAVFESGTIVMVNDVMNDIGHCEQIQEIGCAILAEVTAVESMDMFLIILQTDGLKALAAALLKHGNNQNVRFFATKALSRLSGLSAIVPELAALEIDKRMALLLREHEDDKCFCVNAIQLLGNMADSGEHFQNTPDAELIDTCFDLLRSQRNAADIFYYCLAYIRLFNLDYLSTQSRNAWTTILIETLDMFLGVASICVVSLELLSHLYSGDGVERLPAMNDYVVHNTIFALIDNPAIIKAGLLLLSKLDNASEDSNLFTILIMVLYIFHENEELAALALNLLQGEMTERNEWTGYEVDAVVGTLANFVDSYSIQRRSTTVIYTLWQNYQLLLKDRAEQLVPLLISVQHTFNDQDCGSMAQTILREIEVM